ncbi:DNA topoisomerase (ATP-hydrolyzing) subunit B [Oribacterium sp. P9]|uniref:DNA topoisomerase (ATP-hydrolyzing) subunit B n=1 Tax=unclassified Oribacterium TaxID=2629782 RepID=UPI002A7D5272|nr:DNA topoisomerase (ATP-hydrolyzing) subunit B [Oribacterium sp.]MDD6519203.1 DNA topoisomerase (ATP-hydrolyzing) subunit B [Oribacterium sp.]MDY2854045.1 DNA topoisomerase (ATP-hydrolyzing) subunit B [Oliverpabstia sp.]
MKGSPDYSADQIQILEGLEAVRKRPGMYIGSTSIRGLHHLVYEIVDNSVDEALAGFCDSITVTIEKDNSITVQDDGRGIPVDIQKKAGKPALEVVFTVLHAGGKFGGSGYKVSGGLHGVGASVVNALSIWLEVSVYKGGKIYNMKFERGKVVQPMTVIGECDERQHGTKVHFLPDPEIFEETVYDYDTLKVRLRETAFLTKALKITLIDAREGKEQEKTFHYEGGIKEFVQYLNKGKEPLYPDVIYCEGERDHVFVEVAMQHNDSYTENTYTFVNNINTPEGGTHLTGFKNAITKTFNDYARSNKLLKESEPNLSGDDIREGLTTVISVKIEDPQFEGQTKQKLGNSEAQTAVQNIVGEQLTYYLEQNPSVARAICEKSVLAQRARAAARRARDLTRRKSALDGVGLPGKLVDCNSKDPNECEIFIVEGDSALGPAKDGRNVHTQAVLPLRGKVLNVQKARLDRVYANEEIKGMITAFGTGINEDFDISKLRYNKIIIMTDADVDGAHIATLMLTFIYNFMPELIKQGHVYLAQPPLFNITKNKKHYYAYSDEEYQDILKQIGAEGTDVSRFKGLGEMDTEELAETTMDPETRTLLRVNMNDDDRADLDVTFTTLMGDQVEPRREFIEENAKYVTNLDV